MAEEAKGQRFSQRAGGFLDKITGSQGAQQTQQTQQQTSGQQSTGGIFLPGISNNQNLINSNKVSMNNGFTQGIQDGTIKSNIVLPGITNKPNEATLDTTTMKQKRQSYIYAKNNNINTKSINEQIEEERTGSNKVLGQTGKILKTYREAPINNFKKRGMRAIADSGLPGYFVDKTLEKAGAPDGLGDSIKDAVNETARKVALTYQNKVNEDFQKKVDKNIDARIREKYDNESITDLIGKGDGAGARYKIWKGTVENWNMIPEIGLMFVNPYVGLATMGTDVYIQENQGTFEDMLQNGATYEQARNGAVAVGILNAGIELFMERFLGGAKWAGATALRRLFLKNAQREVVKQATKKGMAEIFARGVGERLKGSMVEGFEEVLQQITGNIMVKLINPDRDILDGARESFEGGFYNLFNGIGGATNIANEFKQNEQIQRNADIEALKYVAEGEQRKAQRMAREKARARFLERVKNPTMDNGYTPTPEQAQQRAREKEENEQFEDELRAEQNRENSRYQETEGENSGLSNSNDYSTDTTISKDYSHSDMVNTDSTNVESNGEVNSPVTDSTFFSTDENGDYINYNGRKIYAGSKAGTKDQFTQLSDNTPYNPEYEEYFRNFQRLVEKLSDPKVSKRDTEIIGHTIKGKEVKMSKQALRHIFESHGKFNINTILEAINNPSGQKRETETTGNNKNKRPYMVLNLVDPSKKVIVAIKANNGATNTEDADFYYVVSSRESNAPTTPSEDVKFQLKYEDKDYTPGVANKNEKDISGKSGKMLKDFLKGQTIEELAKKYGVERIDVVKGLVDGMAYGSYSNRILRLAEEIKESTAPHELLHLVFDMVDPETKTYLISQVMQSEGWSAEKAEEWLADSFSNFYRTGKIESAPKSTWGKIKIFFKRVRSFINGMWKWRNQLEQMFTDIIESSGIEELQGKIDSNKEINEAKAKMRKRFLEYRKNTIKTQERAENENKYQKTGKNEKNEYNVGDKGSLPQPFVSSPEYIGDESTRGTSFFVSKKDSKGHDILIRKIKDKKGNIIGTEEITSNAPKNDRFLNIEELPYDKNWDKYFNELNDLIYGDKDRAIVGKVEARGKIYKVAFDEESFLHVFNDHGGFNKKNFLATVNNPDFRIIDVLSKKKGEKELSVTKDKINLIKELPNSNSFLVVGANLKKGYYIATHFEIVKKKGDELIKQLNRGKAMDKKTSDYMNTHFQLAGDTNSEAFKKRFGDSKVVDGNGNPKIVYHGTRNGGFTSFNKNDSGIRFSEDIDVADSYAGDDNRWTRAEIIEGDKLKDDFNYEGDEGIYKVYLSIKNPLVLDYEGYGATNHPELSAPSYYLENLSDEYDGVIAKNIRDEGGWNGGVNDPEERYAENTVYGVKNPNQVKSATDNVGTYDPNNEDIRYQRVYHGSPAEFDRFDSSHMGEGEGAQAHGWGHYVAVEERTGRHYADMRHYDNEVEIQGRTITNPEDLWDVSYFVRELYRDIFRKFSMSYDEFTQEALDEVIDRKRTDYNNVIEYMQNLIDNPEKPIVKDVNMDSITEERKAQLEGYKDALEKLEELSIEDIKVRPTSIKRNFYEVEIPDSVKADTPTGKNYLEEDEALTDKEIKKFGNTLKRMGLRAYVSMFDDFGTKMLDYNKKQKTLLGFLERASGGKKMASKILEEMGYDGIHYYGDRDGEAYVIFNDNDLEIKNHEKYQKVEYEYDEEGNRKWIKFEEDNGEFDPSIFGEPSREEQIADDKENEKNNPFYNAWIKYNNQNYKDDQLTFEEFIQGISERGDKEQAEYNKKLSDISEAQNDPQLLDLQLRAVKLMEEEGNVGKKFGKNVSKEVRDRQQKEVESKREQLISDIVDYMYPGLKTEEITYDMQKEADQKEAEREMLGREDLEEKLKYFKKDKNGNREAKEVKIENPQIKLDKILSVGKFEEIFTPLDRVIEWRTPQGQHGVIDNQKNPKKYKSVMEKINAGKTKTKVTLKDVTRDYRALEKYKADQEAEKARKKKERDEAYAKKKQEEYKKMVRMKAFQRLVDMQRFEKYPFLTEEEIKNRYGFNDQEWKTITEQEEIKLPKKWGEKAISDFNKAVYDQVRAIRDGLERQNKMKMKDAEKNLGEIGEIDVDILLGRDEEKGQREVEEFEKIAEEEKKKSKKEKNKRLEQAREDVTQVEIDKERENSKSEKERVDKIIKSTKTDKTVRGSAKETATNVITPVSTRIRKISPKIYRELMRYFQNKDILTNERLKEIDPFLKAMGKIRKENPVRFMDIWVALANRNIGYANGLLQEYGVKVPTKLLDTIYDEAEDVGLNINYLGSYYPLSVKAPKSFLEELMKVNKGDIASEIKKRIQEESKKKGGPLDESEVSAIINDVIAGEEKGPDVNVGNKHLKKRNTEIQRTPQMLEYCDDPISTIIGYIEGMTQSIERAKFLGKSRSGNIHDLGDYVYNAKNGLMPDQQDELMELLKSVFNDESPNKFFQAWRDIATLTTLGSPSSTLTQLSDLGFSIYENGWRETLKAVWDIFASRKGFDLQDMGVVNRGEEYTNINSQKNLLQKAIHNVFTYGNFFSQFDTFGKSTFIQSTWRKRQKRALKGENGDPQLRKDIQKWTDDEYMTDKIINDLKKGVFSEDVALVMYMKLGNIQPLTKAQMPKAYLDYPNRRIFYQFKTFGIKQLDYVLQETKENMKGWKNLSTTEKYLRVAQVASMIFIMTLMGVGASELKDISMRRRSNSLLLRWIFGENVGTEQIWDKISDSALQLFGLSRYTVMQAKSDPVDAILSLFTTVPATNIIEYPFRDILKAFKDDGSINWRNPSSYQLIPVIGKYRYWIYGGGQDKQQEALEKENKKSKGKGKAKI